MSEGDKTSYYTENTGEAEDTGRAPAVAMKN